MKQLKNEGVEYIYKFFFWIGLIRYQWVLGLFSLEDRVRTSGYFPAIGTDYAVIKLFQLYCQILNKNKTIHCVVCVDCWIASYAGGCWDYLPREWSPHWLLVKSQTKKICIYYV